MNRTQPVNDRLRSGEDAAIVLIPGLMCDMSFWEPLCRALSPEREVYVPRLHDLTSLADMAESILSDTDGPIDVIGHSMGGRVAFEVWDQAPDRIRSLAVLDTGVHPVGTDEPARRQILLDIADEQGIAAVAAQWIPGMVHPDRVEDADLMDRIHDMVTSYSPDQFRGQVQALLGRRDATPLLATITCPTLVACGSHDAWSPPAQHQTIASSIGNAQYAEIGSAGHMVAMEQPAATLQLLSTWLKGQPS